MKTISKTFPGRRIDDAFRLIEQGKYDGSMMRFRTKITTVQTAGSSRVVRTGIIFAKE